MFLLLPVWPFRDIKKGKGASFDQREEGLSYGGATGAAGPRGSQGAGRAKNGSTCTWPGPVIDLVPKEYFGLTP